MEARFLNKVKKCENGCWEWTAGKDKDGYGKYRKGRAHRFAYELWKGPIPDGLYILHSCDNPPCVNPEHLEIGTNQDNVNDRQHKNRQAKGDNHGRYTRPETTARGEKQGGSKLTADCVREIKILREFGFSLKELGKMYSVHCTNISVILRGKSWKHVPSG